MEDIEDYSVKPPKKEIGITHEIITDETILLERIIKIFEGV